MYEFEYSRQDELQANSAVLEPERGSCLHLNFYMETPGDLY